MNIRDLKCLLALNRTVLHLSWLRQCRRRTVRLLAWLSPKVSDFVKSLGKYENMLTTITSKQSSIKGRGCLNREIPIPFKTTSKVQNFVAYIILKKKNDLLTIATNDLFIIHSVFWNEKGQRSFTTLLCTHLVKSMFTNDRDWEICMPILTLAWNCDTHLFNASLAEEEHSLFKTTYNNKADKLMN